MKSACLTRNTKANYSSIKEVTPDINSNPREKTKISSKRNYVIIIDTINADLLLLILLIGFKILYLTGLKILPL